MLNVILIDNFIHHKNKNALLKYKNIKFHIIKDINNLYKIDLKNFDAIYSPSQPIDVSKFPNSIFLFGPHFSVFPKITDMLIIKGNNSVYTQPSEWCVNIWNQIISSNNININIKSLPFGVDTNQFKQIYPNEKRKNVFLYFKDRNPIELGLLLNFLKDRNISVKLFDYSSKYSESEYLNYLHNSKYGIWLGRHESQGFALEEALSCNVPLFVWNVKSMKQEYKSSYPNIYATTIPYWDERCGEFFHDVTELKDCFNKFISKLDIYKPRDYVLENLSFELCEKKFIDIIKN